MAYQFPSDVAKSIRERMSEGNYSSEDDLLRDALEALAARNADLAAIQAGIEDMEAGRTRPLADVANDIRRKHGWTSDA